MLGNILIDKLKFNIPEKEILEHSSDIKLFVANLKQLLSNKFPDGAYTITNKYQEIKITLNPTRYINPKEKGDDFNLDMPSENWLYNLFEELGFYNAEYGKLNKSVKIIELHLTKNIITNDKPYKYIDYLSSRNYKRMKSEIIKSNNTNRTLSIATHKINNSDKNTVGDRQFIFYDKAQQIETKAHTTLLTLKKSLTFEEQKYIPDNKYVEHSKILNISNLNLLRCELQYKHSNKLKKLQNFITGNKDNTCLCLQTVLMLLKEKKLYRTLDDFYTQELREYIFNSAPENLKEHLTGWNGLLFELSINTNLKTLTPIYKKYNLEKSYKKKLKELDNLRVNSCYLELYQKLGLAFTS